MQSFGYKSTSLTSLMCKNCTIFQHLALASVCLCLAFSVLGIVRFVSQAPEVASNVNKLFLFIESKYNLSWTQKCHWFGMFLSSNHIGQKQIYSLEVPESTSDQQQKKRGFKDIAQTAAVSKQSSQFLGMRGDHIDSKF